MDGMMPPNVELTGSPASGESVLNGDVVAMLQAFETLKQIEA